MILWYIMIDIIRKIHLNTYIYIYKCLRSALSPKCRSPCVPCTLLDLCGSSHTNAQSTDAPSCFRSRNGLGNVGLNEMQNGICRHMNKSTNTPPNLRCPSADYTFDAFGKFNWHGNFHPWPQAFSASGRQQNLKTVTFQNWLKPSLTR